jgi:16S rRNA (adenine1518-N6/adenine1519-N6)-dimethyltransferase
MVFPSISIIKSLHIKPSKALGQNFLIDQHLAHKIITTSDLSPADVVIEIGAGLGALTTFLAEKAKQVIAIEIDPLLTDILQRFCPAGASITIINDNILNISLANFIHAPARAVLVGNIPYAITTSLFTRFAEISCLMRRGIFMVQKEAGERLIAEPGNKNYGVLSIQTQRYFNITRLFDVPASCFFPKPKIDSTVLRMEPVPGRTWDTPSEDIYREIVTASLAHRRKTLSNCLKAYCSGREIDAAVLKARLHEEGIDCSRRGETLSLLEFEKLAAVVTQLSADLQHR